MSETRLDAAYRGFRERYLSYADLSAQLEAWAAAFPEVVRLTSLAKTPEGRDVWLLTLGRDPERRRPAAWVDANIHATELAGSSVALAIAEDVLRVLLGAEDVELPAAMRARVDDLLVYVLPRMSADGAEAVLTTGKYVRSNPRDRRPASGRARWIAGDVDGDGRALLMRQRDATGDYVESPSVPGVMVRRVPEDEGPFFKLYTEGTIEGFDGQHVPDPHYLADNDVDLNRNFPFQWMDDGGMGGSGPFPASEPESRAVVEFASAHREIVVWLSLHTFGGIFLRPPGDKRDAVMDPGDLAIYRQLEAWGSAFAGYPTGSIFNEFLYQAETPLRGELTQYAYAQQGALSYVCELWDLLAKAGLEVRRPFVDNMFRRTRADYERLARWDSEHNQGRVFVPWRAFVHPQIGAVEVGGYDPLVGITNPPYEELAAICRAQSAVFLRMASLAPKVVLERHVVTRLDGDLVALDVTFANVGYLGTYGVPSARKLAWNEPLAAEVAGVTLAVAGDATRREVGHLEGWGRGLFDDSGALMYFRSRGTTRRTVRWVLRRGRTARVRVGSVRMGFQEFELGLD